MTVKVVIFQPLFPNFNPEPNLTNFLFENGEKYSLFCVYIVEPHVRLFYFCSSGPEFWRTLINMFLDFLSFERRKKQYWISWDSQVQLLYLFHVPYICLKSCSGWEALMLGKYYAAIMLAASRINVGNFFTNFPLIRYPLLILGCKYAK